MLQSVIHYTLHFIAPLALAYIFFPENRHKAFWVMIATMLVDVDHLIATPIFDPNRCSIGFHPLHSYWAIGFYICMCFLPYARWGLPWWIRAIAIGLVFHMLTDFQDYYLWKYIIK